VQDLVAVSILSPEYMYSFDPPQSKGKDEVAFWRKLASFFPVLGCA